MKKYARWLLVFAVILLAIPALGFAYTAAQLSLARSKWGVHPTAEVAMRSLIEKTYFGIHSVDIVYAGTNSFDGSVPYVWYVIAEVRADSRTDGSPLNKNGCDSPGTFFLDTQDGWVFMPEGAFPGVMGFWMEIFDLAGPGQATPSTNWQPGHSVKFCQGG